MKTLKIIIDNKEYEIKVKEKDVDLLLKIIDAFRSSDLLKK